MASAADADVTASPKLTVALVPAFVQADVKKGFCEIAKATALLATKMETRHAGLIGQNRRA